MKSHRPVGGYGFGLRLFSPDFILRITQFQPENNLWLKPMHALASAWAKATAALRAVCKSRRNPNNDNRAIIRSSGVVGSLHQ